MKLRCQSIVRRRSASGFSLVEMMIALVIGIVVIGAVLVVAISTRFNYMAMGNYAALDDQSRHALDYISREVRDSSQVIAFSTNAPQYLQLSNQTTRVIVTLTYSNNMLTLAKTGQTNLTLLTGCTGWGFSLYDKYPLFSSNSITFCPSTNAATGFIDPTFTKVINMTWKCQRTILGTKLNTESVQTAQIILRNKVK